MSDVEMKVWMRGRSASRTAFHAASMSATCVRARPQMTGPSTCAGDRLDRLEVAGRGDREAGLDDVDAEPGELLGDLELLGRVQRDAGRLLAVAQRRVEDQYSVGIRRGHGSSLAGSSFGVLLRWGLRLRGRHALIPLAGEEKKERGQRERHLRRSLAGPAPALNRPVDPASGAPPPRPGRPGAPPDHPRAGRWRRRRRRRARRVRRRRRTGRGGRRRPAGSGRLG